MARSDLKSFSLSGEGVAEFIRRALPLLDGEHDAEGIADALPEFGRDSTLAVLANLERIGLIEAASEFPAPSTESQDETLAAFFRHWAPDSLPMSSSVAAAHVAVIGLNESAAVACEGLIKSGIGRLTLIDTRDARNRYKSGALTAAHLASRLRKLKSPTAIDVVAIASDQSVLEIPLDHITLLLVTVKPDELRLLDAVARTAQQGKIRYLVAHIYGLSAMVGPVVIPGESACWECLRRRQLANEDEFDQAAVLHAKLMAGDPAARKSLALPGAAEVLGGLLSLEALKIISNYAPSQLVGRQYELNLVTYDAKMHRVIRLPWCRVCGGAGESGSTGSKKMYRDLSSSRSPDDLRKDLAGWVDSRTGIARYLGLNDPAPDEPQSVCTSTAIINGQAVGEHGSEPLIGSGKGTTKVEAMVGAIGEAIERYSASIYRESDLVRASARKLGQTGFDPLALTLYLPEQYAVPGFPYVRFDPEKEISWAEGTWLDTGRKVRVPALPTYFNYRSPRGEQFCQVTSSGLAAGATFEDASLRATMELIERDAFMMTWLQRRPPQRLDVGTELGDDISAVRSELRDLGMDVELYLMKSDVRISSVMCIAWGDGETRPAAAVALATHHDPVHAVRKAILEQAHIGPYVARLMADEKLSIPRSASDVRTLNDHALFYVPRKRLPAFDFIRLGKHGRIPLSRIKKPSLTGIDACIAALADGGFRVAIADVTAPDVRLGPFRVARALGTYLQPIDFGHQQRRLGNPRLSRNGGRINRNPHPLA